MTSTPDRDVYAVYTGIEDGAATFSLYDDSGVVTQFTMRPENLPDGTAYQDHFRVRIDDREITDLQFDSELTSKKKEEYRGVVETFRQMQERGRSELTDDEEN
jgi:hypothetical protein